MQLGEKLVIRSHGEIKEVKVIEMREEELVLQGESGEEYTRKFWEINRVKK